KTYTLDRNDDSSIENFNAVIVGSEAGASKSIPPGSHLKNVFRYKSDINSFSNIIKGYLQLLSVPTSVD
ncbi:14400_t:CDS:2, partial [Gigaspora rosea]